MDICAHIDCQAPAVTTLRDFLKIEKKTLDKPVFFCDEHIQIFAHWYSLYQSDWVATGTVKELGKFYVGPSLIEHDIRIQEIRQAITWRECFQVPYLFLFLFLGKPQTSTSRTWAQMVHQIAQKTLGTARRCTNSTTN